MALELSIEERYIQHQRGLFVPRNVPVAYVNSAPNCATRVPYQVCPVKERPEQSLHVVVQNLQKQVNELQTLVRSLQHQVPTVPASTPPSEPVAPVAPSTSLARTPSEEELLRLHRQRRQAATEVQSPKVEEQPEATPVTAPPVAPMPAPAAPASLRPSATRELSEPRRTQVKRSWIQGLSKGPSLWQILQQRLHKEESRPTTRRGTSPDGKADEVTGKMSLDELGKYICSDLERRFGCLEVAAAYAALSMEMCSEQEIDTFLATVEDGERGIRLAPVAAAAVLPAISFGAQGFEDALLDVLQVRVSRRNARKLFRQLAALPKKPSAIGSVGTTAQLTQLRKTSLDDSRVLSPGRPVAQTARQPEKGLSRSKSEGRTVPKTTRVEVGVAKRPSLGVHLQEQIRQQWQSGLRDSESPARLESNDPRAELSNVSSRRSSVKASPPPSNQNSANPLPMPGTVKRRSYEVWRRDVSLKSLLAFEAEVKARQESSTASSEDDAVRDLPGSSRSSKLPSDSPPSSRLRRSSEEERLETLPARFSEQADR